MRQCAALMRGTTCVRGVGVGREGGGGGRGMRDVCYQGHGVSWIRY